ncbi:hypothetical protein DMENIID0001_118270 [Sergentomyia squamirostris]
MKFGENFANKLIIQVTLLVILWAKKSLQAASCDRGESNSTYCVYSNLIGSVTELEQLDKAYKTVLFKNCNFPKIPTNVFTVHQDVEKLDMSKSMIRQLSGKSTLSGASKLKILDLSENNLSEVADGVFSEGAELVELYLARNQISTVSYNAFIGLKKLELVDMSFNLVKKINTNIFWDVRQLKFVYLNNNGMSTMRLNFANNSNLVEYDGSHNDLTDWSLTFPSKSKVILNLSSCKLRNTYSSAADKGELIIDGNTVDYIKILGTVTRVSVKYNSIRYVEIDPDLPINTLEFAGNYITDISNITKVTSLEKLDLSENRLMPMTSSSFSSLKELRDLNLRATGFVPDSDILANQKKLIYLDISKNEITSLNLRDLKALTSLKTLFLHENKLTELQHVDDIKEILPSLTTISLSKNYFTCSYIQRVLTLMENLKVQVLLDTKNLNAIGTNILGLDCFATEDSKANSSSLQKMLIFRESSQEIDIRLSNSMQGILQNNTETLINKLVTVNQEQYTNSKSLLERLEKDVSQFSGDILQKMLEINGNIKDLTKLTPDTDSVIEISKNMKELQNIIEANDKNIQELKAQSADSTNLSLVISNITGLMADRPKSSALEDISSSFSAWKYLYIITLVCAFGVAGFAITKLYMNRRTRMLPMSRENLTSSEMI